MVIHRITDKNKTISTVPRFENLCSGYVNLVSQFKNTGFGGLDVLYEFHSSVVHIRILFWHRNSEKLEMGLVYKIIMWNEKVVYDWSGNPIRLRSGSEKSCNSLIYDVTRHDMVKASSNPTLVFFLIHHKSERGSTYRKKRLLFVFLTGSYLLLYTTTTTNHIIIFCLYSSSYFFPILFRHTLWSPVVPQCVCIK